MTVGLRDVCSIIDKGVNIEGLAWTVMGEGPGRGTDPSPWPGVKQMKYKSMF
jgi:hypothetical protein